MLSCLYRFDLCSEDGLKKSIKVKYKGEYTRLCDNHIFNLSNVFDSSTIYVDDVNDWSSSSFLFVFGIEEEARHQAVTTHKKIKSGMNRYSLGYITIMFHVVDSMTIKQTLTHLILLMVFFHRRWCRWVVLPSSWNGYRCTSPKRFILWINVVDSFFSVSYFVFLILTMTMKELFFWTPYRNLNILTYSWLGCI